MPTDKEISIHLAYLNNSWDKIKYFKNRQWATLISYSAISILLLNDEFIKNIISGDSWKRLFVITSFPIVSFVTLLFCFHLKHKISRERRLIKKFEEIYSNETKDFRAVLESDVTESDLGDKLVYGTYIAVVISVFIFVISHYSTMTG